MTRIGISCEKSTPVVLRLKVTVARSLFEPNGLSFSA